ncbi:MAG TPA: methylated-DNA--[protein]-cysteine S-methyltransferase [Bacillota bacterium]|nr:methylated-DNA--[protein]-cysteine S-methyltransferase [Bacillota bacterium]
MLIFSFCVPPGWMAGAWSGAGLRLLVLPQDSPDTAVQKLAFDMRVPLSALPGPRPPTGPAEVLAEEIDRYFRGEKIAFSAPVDWGGYTPFQRRVLECTRAVPYGEVATYARIAERAGSPAGARAVGGVMRANRTPLVVPCHRVIASSGSPGGFTGGLEMKKYLLKLENAI